MMQHPRIGLHQRQRRGHFHHHLVLGKLAAQIVQRGGQRVGQIDRLAPHDERAALDARHLHQIVEQTAQTPCLIAQRFDIGRSGIFAGQRVGGGDNGGERGFEIMPQRGNQRGAQIVALLQGLGAAGFLLQSQTLVRQRGLPQQRGKQHPALWRQRRPRSGAVDAQHRQHAQRGFQRVELPIGGGQRGGVAARGLAPLQRPFGGGDIQRGEVWIGGIGGDQARALRGSGQHQRSHIEQRRDLLAGGARGAHLVGHRAQPLAKGGDGGVFSRRARANIGLAPQPPGHLRRDNPHPAQHQKGDDIVRVLNGQRVNRREEEEIIGQRRA